MGENVKKVAPLFKVGPLFSGFCLLAFQKINLKLETELCQYFGFIFKKIPQDN